MNTIGVLKNTNGDSSEENPTVNAESIRDFSKYQVYLFAAGTIFAVVYGVITVAKKLV